MFGTPQVIRPSASVSVGVVGPKGASLLGDARVPVKADGFDGDFWVALIAGSVQLYGPKTSGVWPSSYLSLTGAQGAPGPQILSGTGAPTQTIGNSGDFYLDSVAAIFYGPKYTGQWPTPGISLVGPKGDVGQPNVLSISPGGVATLPSGSAATASITGQSPAQALSLGIPAGTVIYPGSGAPGAGVGVAGDFYLDLAAGVLYGPRTGAGWPGSGTSLVGPPGKTGNGAGNVAGPAGGAAIGNIAVFADATGTNIRDGGPVGWALVDSPASPYAARDRDEVRCRTANGPATVALSATPGAGARVRVTRLGPNPVTIACSGNIIGSVAADLVLDQDLTGVELAWSAASQAWCVTPVSLGYAVAQAILPAALSAAIQALPTSPPAGGGAYLDNKIVTVA